MLPIAFAKAEAHGNDFLLVSEGEPWLEERDAKARLARAICHRLRGVGADGLIFFREVPRIGEELAMSLFNSDGSEAEISGNGLRCLAARFFLRNPSREPIVRVRTAAGPASLELQSREGLRFRFRARMGTPRLAAKDVPFLAEPADALAPKVPLEVEGEVFEVTALSMGNPHAVLFTDEYDREQLLRIGASIESHPRFPQKTNVELVQVLSSHDIRMGIWERGAGETASSGTGSAAAAVASILLGLAASPVRVHCPGGTMSVEWERGGEVFVTGDAEIVAEGTYFFER